MAYTLAEVRALSDADLEREYDRLAQTTEPVLNFYRDELNRRVLDERNRTMMKMTRAVTWMTGGIVVLTLANVVLVLLALPLR